MRKSQSYAIIATEFDNDEVVIAKNQSLPLLEALFEPQAAILEDGNQEPGSRVFKKLELVGKPVVESMDLPLETLGEAAGEHVYRYMLRLERNDGPGSVVRLSDDLDSLVALMEAMAPTLIEENRHATASDGWFTGMTIHERAVIVSKDLGTPDWAPGQYSRPAPNGLMDILRGAVESHE